MKKLTHIVYYQNGGNEERDKRLQVVKLLTALSYCVGGFSLFAMFLQLSLIGSFCILSDLCQHRNLFWFMGKYRLVGVRCGLWVRE